MIEKLDIIYEDTKNEYIEVDNNYDEYEEDYDEEDYDDLIYSPVEYCGKASVINIDSNTMVEEEENLIYQNSERLKVGMEILFGEKHQTGENLNWYPNDTNKVFHTNTGIIGQMGTGKTQFTKSLITQLYRDSENNIGDSDLGILIFDYKGDYNESKEDFIKATNANVYHLHRLPFNPLTIIKSKTSKRMLPLHTGSVLAQTITKAYRLGQKQHSTLIDIIMKAYENKRILKSDESTWDFDAPTINEVYEVYLEWASFKEDSLYAALKNLAEFEIFEIDTKNTQSLFEVINGVTVIDLSGYDPSIQNLVVAITLDLFYSQMQTIGHSEIKGHLRQLNKIILVDEADNFLSEGFDSIKKILKEGREFGVGTILSTQLLSHFASGDNDYSKYILTWIIHSVTDITNKDVKYIFNTKNKKEEEALCTQIKSLTKHYSLVKMGSEYTEIKDKAFWELIKE